MVREYIGARYVPKFMGTYDPTQIYEALCVVDNGSGTSYISKVPTPAGTPLTDTTYWSIYGAASGAIINLQKQIDDMQDGSVGGSLQNQINTVNDNIQNLETELYSDDIIFIGDSYGLDAAIEDGGASWATILSSVYPNATFLMIGGVGFASDAYISNNFLTMLTAHVATLTTEEKDKVKQVVVVGGANDGNLIHTGSTTASVIKTRIESFCDYVSANLPHAKVKCAFVGWYRTNPRHGAYLQARDAYAIVSKNNYQYFSNGEPILMGNDAIGSIDNIHPLTESSKQLAAFVSSMANNGNYKCSRTVTATIDATTTSADSVDNILSINCYYDGDTCSVTLLGKYDGSTYFRMIFPTTTVIAHTAYVIGNVVGTPVGAIDPVVASVSCLGFNDGGTNIGIVPAVVTIQNNQLIIKFTNTSDQIKTVLIPWFTLTFNMRHS